MDETELSEFIMKMLESTPPAKHPCGYYSESGDALRFFFEGGPHMAKHINKYLTLYVDIDNPEHIVGMALFGMKAFTLLGVDFNKAPII